jgi:hypothetical protein
MNVAVNGTWGSWTKFRPFGVTEKGRNITELMTVESSKNGPFNGQGSCGGGQM